MTTMNTEPDGPILGRGEGTTMNDFQDELQSLINKHSQENGSDTPDFILASYLNDCLKAFNVAVQARETWYGRHEAAANSVKDSEGEGVDNAKR